jgi:hypothetical protein
MSVRRVPSAAEWIDGIDEEITVTASRESGRRSIASNRRARHDYTILKTYEAGIVLAGNEVKSLRAGNASLVGAFVQEHDGELMLHGLHIPEHAYGRHGTRDLSQPRRTRKLLMHRSEIDKITAILDLYQDPELEAKRGRCHPRAAVAVLPGRLGEGGDRPGARSTVL